MCNAWNHDANCRCGWGGEGHCGKHSVGLQSDSVLYEDFCRPNKCSTCGKGVYFIRYNGGSVWVDAPLGKPWPKHPCYQTYQNVNNEREVWQWYERTSLLLGEAMLAFVVEARPNIDHFIAKTEDGNFYSVRVAPLSKGEIRPKAAPGSVVLLSPANKQTCFFKYDKFVYLSECKILSEEAVCRVKMRVIKTEYFQIVRSTTRLLKKVNALYTALEADSSSSEYIKELKQVQKKLLVDRDKEARVVKEAINFCNLYPAEAKQEERTFNESFIDVVAGWQDTFDLFADSYEFDEINKAMEYD